MLICQYLLFGRTMAQHLLLHQHPLAQHLAQPLLPHQRLLAESLLPHQPPLAQLLLLLSTVLCDPPALCVLFVVKKSIRAHAKSPKCHRQRTTGLGALKRPATALLSPAAPKRARHQLPASSSSPPACQEDF